MKIVDRRTFLAMRPGVLFSKYEPCCFDDFMIKGETLESSDDFLYQSIHDATGFGEPWSFPENESIPMDFDCQGRDGLFDSDQLFAVWEKKDIVGLQNRLKKALIDGYSEDEA